MFDGQDDVVGLLPGESHGELAAWDQLSYEVTCLELADGWPAEDRHVLPDLGSILPGPFLAVLVGGVDRSHLNGFDLVRVLQARSRLISHFQAELMVDMEEISYAAPGDAESDPHRLAEQFEYAADELRAGLVWTRRGAEYHLSFAVDLRDRLPRVWQMLADGHLDLPRCRVIANGTAHLETDEARQLVDDIADRAPGLTTGQLAALIRRLCVSVDPEKAKRRVDQAREDRSLVIEPTVDGVADVHILGMKMGDARAFGRRVNRHMFSLQKEDRSGRTHDQLRADIATDMLLGGDATNGGRGLVDIHVPVSVLDGGSEPGEIGGLGPVTADTARHIVETQSEADHQITLIDENGNPTHVYTLSRRATKQIRRHMAALQPTCTFPGCVAPAEDCDFDHLTPRSQGGETSTTNGGPKCDHDHTLKDHGWIHRRRNGRDIWVSPLGHTYITQGQSP